jgi:hypothetical protein
MSETHVSKSPGGRFVVVGGDDPAVQEALAALFEPILLIEEHGALDRWLTVSFGTDIPAAALLVIEVTKGVAHWSQDNRYEVSVQLGLCFDIELVIKRLIAGLLPLLE